MRAPRLALGSTLVALLAALLVALLAACWFGGISREGAISLAAESAGPTATVVRAERGPLGQFADTRTLPEEPRGRDVWAVVFAGSFPGSCVVGEAGPVCPPDATTKLVVLDAQTGAFIFAESPAP